MQTEEKPTEGSQTTWRIKLGFTLFVVSICWPVIIPILPLLGVPAAVTATIGGVMLVVGELLMILAAAVSGKEGFAVIKQTLFGFLKSYGPPAKVGRTRYYIGLTLFLIPLAYGWVSPYVGHFYPALTSNPLLTSIIFDLLLLVSLFILGGEFWEKLRALFRYEE